MMPFAPNVYTTLVLVASPLVTFAKDNISTASFVVAPPMNSDNFFKTTRGRCHVINDAMNVVEAVSLPTQAQVLSSPVDTEILEESPVRPPAHV
jgi:hypothetical protein